MRHRQRYETREDLSKESQTLKIFSLNMNCTFRKVDELDIYSPDATFWRNGERVAVGEVKNRNNKRDKYSTYIISAFKVDHIFDRWFPLPFFLIVRWEDGIYWVAVTGESKGRWMTRIGGRTDRNEEADIERCYHIPIGEFTRLKMDGFG